MNKSVYLDLKLLYISKVEIYDFWNDYIKPRYGEKSNLCYMNTDRLIAYMKTKDFRVEIPKEVETRFNTSNY